MIPIQIPSPAETKSQSVTAPRVSLVQHRLHFVSYPSASTRPSLRLRLTRGLVGRR